MVDTAVNILRRGGLVAFATETVYGLGADATNSMAVRKIFAAKGRPPTNPLIVHIADAPSARRFTTRWTDEAEQLAARFWPGPITLVLPKALTIVDEVTAGRGSVGLRVPNHPLALQLLRAFDGPMAAPSANRANHVSPTRAEHVRSELGDAVDLVLDGGPCAVGIESTVIDLTGDRPQILRPGGISRQQIEAVIGPVNVFCGSVDLSVAAASPGQGIKHYSPVTPTFHFEIVQRTEVINALLATSPIVMLGSAGGSWPSTVRTITMPADPAAYARQLYQTLRSCDEQTSTAIYIELPPDEPQWLAIRDRLLRAASPLML